MKILHENLKKREAVIYTSFHPPKPAGAELSSRGIDFLLTKQVTPREPDQKFTGSSISPCVLP